MSFEPATLDGSNGMAYARRTMVSGHHEYQGEFHPGNFLDFALLSQKETATYFGVVISSGSPERRTLNVTIGQAVSNAAGGSIKFYARVEA